MMRPPLGSWILHQAEGTLGAEEHAGQINVDHPLPILEGELVEGHAPSTGAGIVEQDIQAAVGLLHLGEERIDRGGIGHIGGHGEAMARRTGRRRLLQRVGAPSG